MKKQIIIESIYKRIKDITFFVFIDMYLQLNSSNVIIIIIWTYVIFAIFAEIHNIFMKLEKLYKNKNKLFIDP